MLKFSHLLALGAAMLLGAPAVQASEQPQEWDLVNPAGVIKIAQIKPAKRISTLERQEQRRRRARPSLRFDEQKIPQDQVRQNISEGSEHGRHFRVSARV